MKENYNLLLKKEIEQLNTIPNLLLHSCCGPCSTYVISYLTNNFNITIIYYNPNIYPEEEYLKRKKEQIKLINNIKTKNKLNIIDADYNYEEFKEFTKGLEKEPEGGSRCNKCFYLRLKKTCLIAKKNNYDYFGTTLTVSPYKNAKTINEIGKKLEKENNIKWLMSDFKKEDGYKKSIELSKKYNLYRQHYCGCEYSIYDLTKV